MHVAIIMDGNGRWAAARGLPRVAGHRKGADAARRTLESAPGLGISTLTLYAFSSDNWRRPPGEVGALMQLFRVNLELQAERSRAEGVRLSVIGRRDRLPVFLVQQIAAAESLTAAGTKLHVGLAVDYSAREAIAGGHVGPDVDLLIRTGGEQRLSDFLLWECAYAELLFVPRMWPDFDGQDLRSAVHWFRTRERRFGALPGALLDQPRGDRWLR